MAYADDSNPSNPDNTQQAQQQRLAQTGPNNPSTGGGSTGLFGNATPGGAPASGNAPAQSNSSNSGWTNLQSYLNVNQDQAAGMGQQVAGAVDAKASAASKAVDNLSNDWGQQVKANTVTADPNAVNQAVTDATTGGASTPNWDTDLAAFRKQAGAKFDGSTDFTTQAGYGAAAQNVSDAQNALSNLSSEAGRDTLLQNQYGNASQNGYSKGENTLDQALVETNSNAQKAFSDEQQKQAPLSGALQSARDTGNAAAQQAVTTDRQTAQDAANAFGSFGDGTGAGGTGAAGTWEKGIADQTTGAQDAYTKAQAKIATDSGNNNYSPDELAALGLTLGQNNYGVKVAPYVQAGTTDTSANVASTGQYGQANALDLLGQAILSGQFGSNGIGTNILQQQYASQAATGGGIGGNALYSLSPTYQSDVAAAKAAIPGQEQDIINKYIESGNVPNGTNPQNLSTFQNMFSTDPNSSNYIGTYLNAGHTINNDPSKGGSGQTTYQADPVLAGQWGAIQNAINGEVGVNADNGGRSAVRLRAHGGFAEPTGWENIHQMLATGGFADAGGDKIPGPMKEPRIPKLPKADYKLPTMPKFAEGGDVPYTHVPGVPFDDGQMPKAGDSGYDSGRAVPTSSPIDLVAGGLGARLGTAVAGGVGLPGGVIANEVGAIQPGGILGSAKNAVGAAESATPEETLALIRQKVASGEIPGSSQAANQGEMAANNLALLKQARSKYTSRYADGGSVGGWDNVIAMLDGGQVPGKAKVAGDSYANDTVNAKLSPEEIVVPRSVTTSQDPVGNGAKFIAETLAKKYGKK